MCSRGLGLRSCMKLYEGIRSLVGVLNLYHSEFVDYIVVLTVSEKHTQGFRWTSPKRRLTPTLMINWIGSPWAAIKSHSQRLELRQSHV